MNQMVQNASPDAEPPAGKTAGKTAGRPPQFDTAEVVDAAVNVFWRTGYDGTSLAELEDGVGVNRSTLYASFDGKAGLYQAAVSSYVEAMESRLVTPLTTGTAGLADLLAFVERLRELLTDSDHPDGCLIVNAMGSGQPPAATHRYLATLRSGFEAALSRAADLGEVDTSGCDARASTMLSTALGLNVAAKAGISGAELGRLIDGFRDVIAGWLRDAQPATTRPSTRVRASPR